jgi:hypothetical protein
MCIHRVLENSLNGHSKYINSILLSFFAGAVRSRSGGVVALPPHFRVDDPDESAFEADFGRRISRHNSNDDLQDQIVQASTQEEIKASRVRKRNFSTSVISERTIQIRDEDDENSLDRTETSKTIPPSTTSTTERSTSTVNAGQQLGLGSSRAVIRYVSTVPPAPFGTKPHSGSTGGLPVNPTSNPPGEDQRKVSIRTVLRRPPLRSQQTTRNQDSTARTTTTVRSEKSPSNTTLATHQLRTRVRIKETLLARVQGRLRARSTTETPQHTTIKDLTPSSTSTARDPTTIGRSTTMTPSTTTTDISTATTEETTEDSTPPEVTESLEELLEETTFKLQSTETFLEDRIETLKTPETPELEITTTTEQQEEEEEITRVSVSMDESQVHSVVMTTLRSGSQDMPEDTTNPIEDLSANETLPRPSTTLRPPEGILGSSLERPDGLQKELLAAIRRKISKTRNQTRPALSPKKFFEIDPSQIDVSPASNSVGSTQHPPFFRPIPFPSQPGGGDQSRTRQGPGSNPRVKIYLRVPDEKAGSNVKIPPFSRIHGKLARLNAAISEGLRNDRIQKEQQEAEAALQAAQIKSTSIPPVVLTSTSTSSVHSSAVGLPSKPRLGAYNRTTTTATPASVTVSTSATISSFLKEVELETEEETEPPIAVKTHTYLDILRQRKMEKLTSSTTTTTTTTTQTTTKTTTQTTTQTTRSTATSTTTTTEKTMPKVVPPKDHPSSHLRPKVSLDDDTPVVRPGYGEFIPPVLIQEKEQEQEQERIVRNNEEVPIDETDSSVIHDITGTTVYVVGVICVIPAAGLVAWVVRFVVKRRESSSSESSSETGLNCPISDDDMVQVNKFPTTDGLGGSSKRKGIEDAEDAELSATQVSTTSNVERISNDYPKMTVVKRLLSNDCCQMTVVKRLLSNNATVVKRLLSNDCCQMTVVK